IATLNIGAIKHWKGIEMSAWFQFDSSAPYQTRSATDQADINKLWGFTDCNRWDPQNGSARFGWRWVNNAIEILAYVDRDGTPTHLNRSLGTLAIGEVGFGTIRLEGHEYAFYFKGKRVTLPRDCDDSLMKGYYLYPYFGGNETAPHDFHIRTYVYTL